MAWIIGQVSDQEAENLALRGWEFELYDNKSLPPSLREMVDLEDTDEKVLKVYVDSDLFQIMSGPNWEK